MSGTIEVAGAVRDAFTGELIGPADPAYEQARTVHNGLIDKRPALIARCRQKSPPMTRKRAARFQSRTARDRGAHKPPEVVRRP